MSGGFEARLEENQRFFASLPELTSTGGIGLDLGCGSGFQSLALAMMGFQVIAVDSDPTLIDELECRSKNLPITRIVADLRDTNAFEAHAPFDMIVCMGDSLTHLESVADVSNLTRWARTALRSDGVLIFSFRDLTKELTGIDRALPVKLDEDRLMATFLEYETQHVVVNDLLFTRDNGVWSMQKSAYRKLRLSPQIVTAQLNKSGFSTIRCLPGERGFVHVIAKR